MSDRIKVLHLYAAYLNADDDQFEQIMARPFSKGMMETWQRVYDAAQGRWKPRAMRNAPKVEWAAPEPQPDGVVWCEQCDSRRHPSQVLACQSRFCKAKPT